jgi:superfamily II DNA/RNA helicase
VCVVSRVGDRGISFPDLRLVIEVAGAGSAREQFAQRVGRLLHGEFEGTFITVFTPEEAAKYRGRVFGVEAELAGSVDIEFINVGNVSTETVKTVRVKPARPARVATPREAGSSAQIGDEITQVLALPAIAAKLLKVKEAVGQDSVRYVERVLRYCWESALSPKEITEGLGMMGHNALSRISSASKGLERVNLMTVDGEGRYQVNQAEISRLRALSNLRR